MNVSSKDSCKRLYRDDGTFHHPNLRANLLQKQGQLYFEDINVSGSNHGTAKDPQYALKIFFDNHWLPEMDEKA
jgi:hypothetical protein